MGQRYQLLTKIGAGGMAEVYHARQIGPSGFAKEVAVKRLLPQLTSEQKVLDMFVDEARILSDLNHPNIVQVHAFERIASEYFLIMEYVHGASLARLMARLRETVELLPANLVAHIGAETARGLAYAHTKTDTHGRPLRIVHRDVSPDNVLLSMNGLVKVVDFGIAKAADRNTETAHGKVKGKYCYMAPERLRSKRVDGRCDLFCLGLVLYEMLTARRLFDGPNQHEVFHRIQTFTGLDPRAKPADAPADLWAVTIRCLAPDPNKRFQQAAEVAAELDGIRRQFSTSPGDGELAALMGEVFPEAVNAPGAEELASHISDDPSLPISWPQGPPPPPGVVTQVEQELPDPPLPPTVTDVAPPIAEEDDDEDEDEPTVIDPERAEKFRLAIEADENTDTAGGPDGLPDHTPAQQADASPDDDGDLEEEPTDVKRSSQVEARKVQQPSKPTQPALLIDEEPTGPTDVSNSRRHIRGGMPPWLQWVVVALLAFLIAGGVLLLIDPF